jgi:hypothetical protein
VQRKPQHNCLKTCQSSPLPSLQLVKATARLCTAYWQVHELFNILLHMQVSARALVQDGSTG